MTSGPALDPLREPEGTPSVERRSTHRLLHAEKAQLAHWRRLLRARLDLVVAGLAPPESLGALTSDRLPDAVAELPDTSTLMDAVSVPPVEDTVELMHRIRVLDRALRRYGEQIDAALEESTRALVLDLAAARTAMTSADADPDATPSADPAGA